MVDNTDSPNQTSQDLTLEAPPNTMAETEQSPPQSAAAEHSNVSFSIWPPIERTRDAVRNRLIENFSTPSILSKKYGTISREEAIDVANRIEEEAFEVAGIETGTDDDDIEILHVYSKEISKRMLETVKARAGESVASEIPPANGTAVKAEEEDAASTAPPQSEKMESVADDE